MTAFDFNHLDNVLISRDAKKARLIDIDDGGGRHAHAACDPPSDDDGDGDGEGGEGAVSKPALDIDLSLLPQVIHQLILGKGRGDEFVSATLRKVRQADNKARRAADGATDARARIEQLKAEATEREEAAEKAAREVAEAKEAAEAAAAGAEAAAGEAAAPGKGGRKGKRGAGGGAGSNSAAASAKRRSGRQTRGPSVAEADENAAEAEPPPVSAAAVAADTGPAAALLRTAVDLEATEEAAKAARAEEAAEAVEEKADLEAQIVEATAEAARWDEEARAIIRAAAAWSKQGPAHLISLSPRDQPPATRLNISAVIMEPGSRAQGATSTASAVPIQAAVFESFFSDEPDGAESDNVARLVEWFHGVVEMVVLAGPQLATTAGAADRI